MADIQSNIDIRIDTSSALASIKLLQAQISAFHTSMAKGTAENVVASKQLQQKLIDSVNATGKFSAGIQSIKTTTESFTTSLEKNKLSLGQYFKYSIAATKSFGGAFKTEMATIDKVARERVKDLQTQYIQLGRDANGAMKSIAVRPLMLDLENLQTRTALAAQKQQILNQLLKQGSTNLLNFGKNTQWAGRQLMVGFTIPLSMAGTAAAKAYMDIEKASVQIRRVYGDLNTTATETNNMVNQIKALAGEYTKYGIAISDTMDMAAKAAAMGKTGADLLAQVNQASKLSALGGVDQNMALETTISLTNAFGTSAEQLSSKINFLNAVENQTVLSIEDMTTAIPKAAPVIKQLGGDVEDLAFFMTAMKEGGINASEGANALKSGLSSLINPSQKASDFLMSFGVNVKAIVEQDKGNLKKTVVDFATALDKIDPLNRARAIEQMFGKFQFARISTLLQNVNKEGSQASRALELANMSSIQLAAISRKELEKLESSPMYKFQKSIADLQLKIAPIGESFLKAVTPIIEKVSDFLDGFNRMGDGFKQFVVVGSAILGGLAPILLMVTGLIANGAANIIKLFANVKAFLNRTSTESQILGETTNYLTAEQIKAEAVAASLDQTHTKLKQTFTSETSSIIALMEAYQGANAAMSRFNVPPISTSIGKGKKLATGGIIRGPGTGTSDSIAAMVSNGEAIIPAKNVARFPGLVNGLVSGNIPGFNKGKRGLAHSHAQEPLSQADYPEAYAEGMKDLGLDKLPQEIISRLKIQLLGSLTAELPQSANIRLREGQRGLSPDEWSGLFQTDGIFASSATTGGMDVKSPAAKKALAEFQERVRQNALDIALEKGLDTIHDPELAQATTRAMEQLGGQKGTMGDLVSTLRKRAATPGQFRATGSNALLKELEAEGSLTPDPTAPRYVTYRDTGTRIGRKRSSGVWNASLDPKKDYTGTYFGQPYMTGSPARQTEEYNNTLATTAKTASESKRTRKIAKDTVDGYANELERSKKKVVTTANKTTQSESDYILRQLDVRKKHAEMVGAETASIEKEIAARRMQIAATEKAILEERSLAAQRSVQSAAAVGPVAVGSNRGTFSSRFSGAVERGLTRGAGRLANLGTGRLAGVGMAASMATFGLAGAGGAVGDVANQLLPIAVSYTHLTLPTNVP
jgi:TP901 family phage tail tape measure protein